MGEQQKKEKRSDTEEIEGGGGELTRILKAAARRGEAVDGVVGDVDVRGVQLLGHERAGVRVRSDALSCGGRGSQARAGHRRDSGSDGGGFKGPHACGWGLGEENTAVTTDEDARTRRTPHRVEVGRGGKGEGGEEG